MMPDMATIADFFDQRHIAVVGVSHNVKDFSRAVYRRLADGERRLYPVTTSGTGDIEGDRCFRSLAEVPAHLDGILVMVPAQRSAGVVREAIAQGVPRVWLHCGIGSDSVSADAVQLCRDHGIAVVDGASPLMFVQPFRGLHREHRALRGRSLH